MANRQRGSVGFVILALFACHRCVGSHVLWIWRFLNFDFGFCGSFRLFLRILGRGGRGVIVRSLELDCSPPPSAAPSAAARSFLFCFRLANMPSFFAVCARIIADAV